MRVFLAVSAAFLSSLAFFSVGPIIPLLTSDLAPGSGLANLSGWAVGVSFLTSAISTPFWGAVAARYGAKLMALRAALGLALTYALTPLASNGFELIAIRALNGLMAGFIPALIAMSLAGVENTRSARILSLFSMSQSAGAMAGPMLGGLLMASGSAKATFYAASGEMLAASAIVLIFLPGNPITQKKPVGIGEAFRKTLESPATLAAVAWTMIGTAIAALLTPLLPLRLLEISKDSSQAAATAGILGTIGGVVALALTFPWAKFTERAGVARPLAMCLGGCGLFALAAGLQDSIEGLVLVFTLYSCAACALPTLLDTQLVNTAPESVRATSLSLNHTARQFGLFLGPVAGGFSAEAIGTSKAILLCGAFFIAFLVARFILRRKGTLIATT